MNKNPDLLDKMHTGLLMIDIQEKILKVMSRSEQVVENTIKLINGFEILQLPIFVTEQNPDGLGKTVEPLKKALGDIEPREKVTFSCCGIQNLVHDLRLKKIKQIVLCGIESHVCVWQTVMDLLHADFQVTVVSDAVSSRKETDCETAMQLMRSRNIWIRSTEMVLFELLESIETDVFKKILGLIK